MTPRSEFRRFPSIASLLALVALVGCGSDRNPMAPDINAPPIEIRADAATYGTLGGLSLESAEIVGRTLRLNVSYSGGCRTHAFAAAASPHFLESFPAQLSLFLRHDGNNDLCTAIVFQTLVFDVTPAIRLHEKTYGIPGPFYLDIITPGVTQPPRVLVR